MKDVIEQGRSSAFAFSTGDTDDLLAEFFHEKPGLGNILRFIHVGDDARTFQNVVKITCTLQDLLFRTLDHLEGAARAVLQEELPGRFSFSSFSPDEDAFVIQLFRDLHANDSLHMQTHFTKFSNNGEYFSDFLQLISECNNLTQILAIRIWNVRWGIPRSPAVSLLLWTTEKQLSTRCFRGSFFHLSPDGEIHCGKADACPEHLA